MKVRDLIKNTVWRPSRDYHTARPAISVFLPTYRRGHDGSFLKAANSILEQTVRDIELIVIDDGSTDGTARQIDALMVEDERISCLTHPQNIGLPAISEYEAFVRSRGEYIAFGFDDFLFDRNALSGLLAAARTRARTAIHGYAEWFDAEGKRNLYGEAPIPHEWMTFYNFLANASLLIPRSILNDVGLYDPHIAATRLCDWDLWRRILRRYPIHRVPVFVGREHGITREDSLLNTYPLFEETMQEYFGSDRDELLRPANFPEFDVWKLPARPSASLGGHILKLRQFFQSREWANSLPIAPTAESTVLLGAERPIVGVFGRLSACTALTFDGLHDAHRRDLIYIPPELPDGELSYHLARCSAVVLVRELFDARTAYARLICSLLEIPLYYLTDDKFTLLVGERADCVACTDQDLAAALTDFTGVLCASAHLAKHFGALQPRLSVREVTPVFDPAKDEKLKQGRTAATDAALRAAFIGGPSRGAAFIEQVVPALRRPGVRNALRLAVRAGTELPQLPCPIQMIDYSASFDEFLSRWNQAGLDILLHPRGQAGSTSYQNANVLLIAHYLGAVPIVEDDVAFQAIGENHGVIKVDGSTESWEAAIIQTRDATHRSRLLSQLEEYCRRTFTPDRNLEVLAEIIANSEAVSALAWIARLRKLLVYTGSRAETADAALNSSTARLAALEADARDRARRLAGPEVGVNAGTARLAAVKSRAFQFALRLRKAAARLRATAAWFRHR